MSGGSGVDDMSITPRKNGSEERWLTGKRARSKHDLALSVTVCSMYVGMGGFLLWDFGRASHVFPKGLHGLVRDLVNGSRSAG